VTSQSPQAACFETAPKLKQRILQVKTIIIGGEASPDPDCAGSQLALRRLLLKLNPALKITLLNDQGCPHNLRWFKEAKHLQIPHDHTDSAELAIVVDGGIERCGPKTMGVVERCKHHALIDHHIMGSSRNYDFSIVNAKAASTTELIFDLAKHWQLDIDPVTADALYIGLVADTGSFQYSSTTSHSLRVAAELIDAGARGAAIAEKIRLERPLDFLTFLSRIYAKLRRFADGRVLICVADKNDLSGLKLGDAPFDQALSTFSFIRGVEVTVMLKGGSSFEKSLAAPWRRLSFRSRGRINVAKLARSLDPEGGGHSCASGCLIVGDDELIIEKILTALAAQF
jgi:bifunctional oligoribonuclease and PAP phosphatase NrnA